MSAAPGTRDLLGFGLFGGAAAWNSGDVGPAAAAIADDLGVSLAAVGVLGGTVFFAGLVIAKLGVAWMARRIGVVAAARITCIAALAGNVVIALSPAFAGVAAGRLLAGVGLGMALVLGPVLAGRAGGVRLVGLFGASVTIGVAAAVGAGSLMRGAGVDWRLDFALAAVIAAAALLVLPPVPTAAVSSGSVIALASRTVGSLPAWRLELLFMTALGVPYVLGVWLIPFLTEDAGLSTALAGALGVGLYALNALMRPEGARLEAHGRSLALLGGVAPIIAAGGLVLIAFGDEPLLAAAGVALAGAGFAIPYAPMYDEAARLFADARVAAIGLFSVGGNLLPLVATPPLGAAIASGDGDLAFLGLAAITLLAGVLNLRPVSPPDQT
jgi:hypothetical protein